MLWAVWLFAANDCGDGVGLEVGDESRNTHDPKAFSIGVRVESNCMRRRNRAIRKAFRPLQIGD